MLSAYWGEKSPLGNKPCLLKWAPATDNPTCANVLVGKYGPLFGCIWGVEIFDACVLTFVWDKTFCLAIKSKPGVVVKNLDKRSTSVAERAITKPLVLKVAEAPGIGVTINGYLLAPPPGVSLPYLRVKRGSTPFTPPV